MANKEGEIVTEEEEKTKQDKIEAELINKESK